MRALWNAAGRDLFGALNADAAAVGLPGRPAHDRIVTAGDADGLPEPARRYLAFMGVVGAVPAMVTAPLRRRAHLRWGATDEEALAGDRTRLVTRIKQRYRRNLATAVTVVLSEFGDFAMMHKMLLGIKARAEAR